ncbi:OmpA family protein [Rhodopseudomonas sp. HC1]|uniref:OmpA family protein n=1 Tax=Rhodopseudomonas infernalis TaxID=2897386 RepID=UPI001EE8D6B8|nr:OmpA family protein [Rhodopseudomonas infernalis]MCG6207862.1 OmpA family protein [Rhodopseudomonas infernalis]
MRGVFRSSGQWWRGAIVLCALWAIAVWMTTPVIEAEVAGQAAEALKNTVLDKTKLTPAGRDIIFSADAFSEEGRRSAVASVEAVPGIRQVVDQTRLVPQASPFVWTIERDVVRVTLGGSAPLPASRARLADATRAEVGGVEVSDRMTLARGAPSRFDAVAMLLVDQIGKLKEGKITLSDTKISLSGMARDLGGREAIAAALRNLPEGYVVADNDIKAPPYVFQANKDPVASTVTLTGYVPDNAVHAALASAAGHKFFAEKVVDNLKASIGAPQGFATAVAPALGALSRLSTGTLVVSDREVRLSGDALFESAVSQIRGELNKDMPPGWTVKAELSVKPAASPVDATVCQQLFNELLGKSTVRFESGSATIDKDSAGLLDRMIETAMRCPSAGIEVSGHTDSDGDAGFNKTLSERRARAVVDYMVRAGLSPERFQAFGYGSTIPAAENDTEAGKAKNRRIDFVIR